MVDASGPAVVRFGRFEADLRGGELRRRGSKVKLQEQPFRALVLLLERAGEVVTRKQLEAALWPDGVHVDYEQGIHTAIQKLRRALSDRAARPRWIETVGRRGYRFIGKTESLSTQQRRSTLFVPGLTTFVGRDLERRLLMERFDAASSGQGQVVLVAGEPGIGKSRLALQLADDLGERPHAWLACRGSPQHQQTPFHPIIELLNQSAAEGSRWDGFSRAVARAGMKQADNLPLVASLLGEAAADESPALQLPPDETRRKLLKALAAWLMGIAETEPLVIVFEDLHWMDPSTLEFIGLLAQTGADASLLLLLTARPELRARWPLLSHHLHLTLGRLERDEIEAMVRSLAPDAPSADVIEVVVERAEGVPLFIEELTKAVLETGSEPGALREIPTSVRSSLLARIDRLGAAREIAQVGAAIGREFPWALLRAISELSGERLAAALSKLVDAELVHQRGLPPEATYNFKHALIQDAAYESLLESQRRALHERIADVLVAEYPERAAAEPELLAHHAEAAGRIPQAIAAYQRAGERARDRSAYEEAISNLRHALALLATQPEGRERDALEAALQLTLGHSITAARGYAHPEVEAPYERARALSEALGDAGGLGRALHSLGVYSRAHQLERASALFVRVLALGEETSDTSLARQGHSSLAEVEQFQGRFASSLAHCEASLAMVGERRVIDGILAPGVLPSGVASWNLWVLGWPDRALARARELVAWTRQLGHPFSLEYALLHEAQIHAWQGRVAQQLETAAEAVAIAEEHGFQHRVGFGRVLEAAARVALGERDALTALRGGPPRDGKTGPRIGVPLPLAIAGSTLLAVGRLSEARNAVEAALAIGAKTGQAFVDSELHRLLGEIALASGAAAAEVGAHYQRALEIARAQEARSYELRAATALARLWSDQDERAEARALLESVYDGFTEGFDTGDLKNARTLLSELGG